MGKTKAEKQRQADIKAFIKRLKQEGGFYENVLKAIAVYNLCATTPAFDESVLAPFIALADEMPVCQDPDCPDSVRQVYLRWQDDCGIPSKKRELPKAAFRALKEATG